MVKITKPRVFRMLIIEWFLIWGYQDLGKRFGRITRKEDEMFSPRFAEHSAPSANCVTQGSIRDNA